VPGLERRRSGAEDHGAPRELRAVNRGVARRISQALLLLEGSVVLLIDDDKAQLGHRREHREARSQNDAGLAARGAEPCARARDVFQCAVHERKPRVRERGAKACFELRRKTDLGNEDERLKAALQDARGEVKVDLGLAAARHAVQQECAKAALSALDDGGLRASERMVRNETRAECLRRLLERFSR
jgi:hypothetical protein